MSVDDVWGTCPECGVSQEEAEEIGHAMRGGAIWECPCGFIYSDDEAKP